MRNIASTMPLPLFPLPQAGEENEMNLCAAG